MFDRLEKILERYEELTRLLADPQVIAQQQKYRDLSREHSEKSEVVRVYQQYKKTKEDASSLRRLAESSEDAEMRQLAGEELRDSEKKLLELEEQLKLLLIPKDPNDDKDCIVEVRSGTGGGGSRPLRS